jgi:hypothetical protein
MSIFKPSRDSAFFKMVLDTVADVTGIPEFRHAPWVVFGHSTDGLFAQNLAVWYPEKTAGILYYKSGNLGNVSNMEVPYTSLEPLRDIPFLAINGRFEEYGPNGPFPGCSQPYPDTCYRQAQWLAMRDTLIKLRADDYRVSMIVDHYGDASHGSWSEESCQYMSKWLVDVIKTQIPSGYPTSGPFDLNRPAESAGWLSDSSLSYLMDNPDYPANPVEAYYDIYPANKDIAFWYPTRQTSIDWVNFHHQGIVYNPPSEPRNLIATPVNSSSVYLEWDASFVAGQFYVIQRKEIAGSFTNIATIPVTTRTYTDNGLNDNTEYVYRVYTYNTDGVSPFSNLDTAKTYLTAMNTMESIDIQVYRKEEVLYVETGEVSMDALLFDITGKKIWGYNDISGLIQIPLTGLKTRCVILQISTKQCVSTYKFII